MGGEEWEGRKGRGRAVGGAEFSPGKVGLQIQTDIKLLDCCCF